MDDYRMPLDSQTEMFCTLCLFTNVENGPEVCRKVVSGEVPCSLIKPSLMTDPFHVLVAANKAAISLKSNQLTTKNVHSELLYNLSICNSISQSLLNFGGSVNDKNFLVALIHKLDDEKSMLKLILDTVKGEKVSISRLSEFMNLELIKKMYKIDNQELNISDITNSIVSRISCKDYLKV